MPPSTDPPDADARPTAADGLASVAALSEPTRRAVYDWVAGRGDWVGRDATARAVGIERGTAAHHLDRLAADGLLETDYRRLTGRRGPGAGRPAKVYRRADREVSVSLPPRDYELAGRMLAAAVARARAEGVPIDAAVEAVSTAEGRRLAAEIAPALRQLRARDRDGRRSAVLAGLEQEGYEPAVADDGVVVLRNCPFHRLAEQETELICGMNLCLIRGALEALDDVGLDARLEPEPGRCCVTLRPAS
jgi:predicted ArsR family transcriptional regulator